MVEENKSRPIVVKRVKKEEAGHHGGSWKIAFADFMTAMFTVFLVLWLLLAMEEEQRVGVGQYFRDPTAAQDPASRQVVDLEGGDKAPIEMEGMPIGEAREEWVSEEGMQELAEEFQNAVMESTALEGKRDQIYVDVTEDGLRVQLVDEDGEPMYEEGSADLREHTEEILTSLAEALEDVPNPISIAGHTDARPFRGADYDNWSLSSDRAHMARRKLVDAGLPSDRIAQVVGYADTVPFDPENPRSAVNRRISVVLMSPSAAEDIAEREQGAGQPQQVGTLPRQPKNLLTPEEQRRREDDREAPPEEPGSEGEGSGSGSGGAPDAGSGGSSGASLLEPDELPPRDRSDRGSPGPSPEGQQGGPKEQAAGQPTGRGQGGPAGPAGEGATEQGQEGEGSPEDQVDIPDMESPAKPETW